MNVDTLAEWMKRQGLRVSHGAGSHWPVDSPEGMISYHVVYAGKDYSLEALPAKARYDVRKGLFRSLCQSRLLRQRTAIGQGGYRVKCTSTEEKLPGPKATYS